MRFRASLREMAADEISAMIDPDRLADLRRTDPHPLFKAFVVGHEGEAEGQVIGVGNVIKRWYRDAVEKLHSKISQGLQLFLGHRPGTNESEGRQPIGEVVGKRLMRVSDRISAVVACYIYPSFRHLPLDVASIEANVMMETEGRGRNESLYVAEVERVTGIALGSKAVNQPGFAGATLLGELQAFASQRHIGDDHMDLTLEDVRTFLAKERVKPSDLFGPEALAVDPTVKGLAEDRVRERIAGEFARRKEAEEKLEKIEKTQAEKEAGLLKELSGLKIERAKSQLGALLEKQRESRKMDDRQVKFVQKRLERFAPTNPDEIEKEFSTFLDSEIDEYGRIARDVFGIEDKPAGGNGKDKGTGPSEGKEPKAESKYIDPATNPMIKLG